MSEPGTSRAAPRFGVADVAVLLTVLLLAALHLDYPFEWDQAMFTLGARVMDQGGFLYRDFWEQKQPAIYLFYWVAGHLFGFGERGVHLLEALWWTAFAAVLLASLRHEFENAWVARIAPLLAIGVYYASTTPWHLTQVEGLVALPLWLCMIAAAPPRDTGPSAVRLGLSGLAGGIVLLFKLAFLPIVAAFWIVAAARALRSRGPAPAAAGLLAALIGAALPVLAVPAFYAAHGEFHALWNATFVEPARLLVAIHGTRFGTLFEGMSWAGLRFGPLIGLAVLGTGSRRARGRDPLTLDLLLWIVLGAMVVLVQRFSWWQYHWLLILTPLAVLAAAGMDVVWSTFARAPGRAPAVALGLALFFTGHAMALAGKGVALARARFDTTPARRLAYQRSMSPLYDSFHHDLDEPVGHVRRSVALVDAHPLMFVVGNPLVYHVMDAPPPLPDAVGLIFETLTREQWQDLARRVAHKAPELVLIEGYYDPQFSGPDPVAGEFLRMLERDYGPPHDIGLGHLYARRKDDGRGGSDHAAAKERTST